MLTTRRRSPAQSLIMLRSESERLHDHLIPTHTYTHSPCTVYTRSMSNVFSIKKNMSFARTHHVKTQRHIAIIGYAIFRTTNYHYSYCLSDGSMIHTYTYIQHTCWLLYDYVDYVRTHVLVQSSHFSLESYDMTIIYMYNILSRIQYVQYESSIVIS